MLISGLWSPSPIFLSPSPLPSPLPPLLVLSLLLLLTPPSISHAALAGYVGLSSLSPAPPLPLPSPLLPLPSPLLALFVPLLLPLTPPSISHDPLSGDASLLPSPPLLSLSLSPHPSHFSLCLSFASLLPLFCLSLTLLSISHGALSWAVRLSPLWPTPSSPFPPLPSPPLPSPSSLCPSFASLLPLFCLSFASL